MPTLYVTEFGRQSAGVPASINVAQAPELLTQTVAIGAGSLQSAVFGASTQLIRVHTDAVCGITIGANPTAAAATAMRMAAGQTEYFRVLGGQKIAVITNT